MPLIDPARLQTLLGPATGRFDVDSLETCESTSTLLLQRAANGSPSGSVLVADRQTAGRGRRGRTWLSEPESSLTFSLFWRFDGPAASLAGLSLAVGVAVAKALEALGARNIGLKWPNDVLIDDRKLAGILVELVSERRGTSAVIGIGLNLATPQGDFSLDAVGLDAALPAVPDRHLILARLLIALAETLDRFAAGRFAALQLAWQSRHAWQGRPVRLLQDADAEIRGTCLGADEDGALLIETPGGVRRFLSGDVSLRTAP
ncbi:MAG: biotin--[acetyl-CoA-carboxylase] ligase [Betaproteobacteria bacterium]